MVTGQTSERFLFKSEGRKVSLSNTVRDFWEREDVDTKISKISIFKNFLKSAPGEKVFKLFKKAKP